ncbi:MAG: GDSL-type esterase/lipase family protein [Candidatus Thiodiazotropha endolucinida]|nr:GDSL-type esterase/lipase family protein [Candidatus Thiodiazotropha taylori]MCW4344553.1 GDSL-type esterase/lipase family protein [Candidatus Thiodiazotropha endolucinida]
MPVHVLNQPQTTIDCNSKLQQNNNESVIVTEDNTDDLSQFSGFSSCEITDPFASIFYHIMTNKDTTTIFFYTRPLFSSIISALEKEFVFPANSDKKFSLKTHVDGKRCGLEVDKNEMTITLSGPGQECWKEKNFKKLTVNMFNNFVDETKTALLFTSNCEDSSNTADRKVYINQEDLSARPGLFVQVDTESPLMRNISELMDTIHTLKGQVATLTAQVNKLVQQAANSTYQTVDETFSATDLGLSPNKSDMLSGNADPLPQTAIAEEMRNSNMIVPDDCQRVTSTPRSTRNRPRGQSQTKLKTREEPVHKPRQSDSTNEQKQVLLIGDSIITGANPKGLKDSVRREGIPGATIDTILKEIRVFDICKFSHIILYIGGNNASQGTDTEYFEEKYDQLLHYITEKNSSCQVLLANSCPRADTDTVDINAVIKRLSQQYNMKLVDMDHAFHNKHGEIIDRYYSRDSIHLSQSGIKRLLATINSMVEIVRNFDQCVYYKHKRTSFQHQRNNASTPQSTRQTVHKFKRNSLCNKCGEDNHSTRQCKHRRQIKCYDCGFYGHKSKKCGSR